MSHSAQIKVADLSQAGPNRFELRPETSDLKAFAGDLGLDGLRKVSFSGEISTHGARDWLLTGHLGATVVQPCIVTLEPVTTRIETDVRRLFVADLPEPDGDDVEMPEDDSVEALGREIDLDLILAEALSLAIPQYPRAEGAELGKAVYTEPGKAALQDEDLKPFAGLAALKDKMDNDN